MLNLSTKELKAIAKFIGIKGYKSKKQKTNFFKARIEKIGKEFNE